MNIAPFVAYQVINKKTSCGTSEKPDAAIIVMVIAVVLIFAIILLLLISNIFAEIEVVNTTSMVVVELTEDLVPKYDEFFVTLSNGKTYEISRHLYTSLTAGEVVEVSTIVKHTFLGDINGLSINGEFLIAN